MRTRHIKLPLIAALMCGGAVSSSGQTPAKEQETKLIAVLHSNAEYTVKADACRELARIGTADAVPALALLLGDEKLAHMARYGLEPIPSPAVDAALRDALGKLKGPQLLGAVGSVGVRRDEKAAGQLLKFLKDPDSEVVRISALALGRIASDEAVKGLQEALAGAGAVNQLALGDGLFRCGEALVAKGQYDKAVAIYDSLRELKQAPHQMLAGAWRGAIMARRKDGLTLLMQGFRSDAPWLVTVAVQVAMEMKEPEVSKVLADEIGKVSSERQILLANVLGKRGDSVALPALFALSKAGEPAARVAAVRAICEIGDASAAEPLIGLLQDPDAEVARAANTGLAGLRGSEVDAAVTRRLDSPDHALKLNMLDMVRQRRITKAMPMLLKLVDDKDDSTRAAAIRSYADLAGETELAELLEKIAHNTNAGEISAIEKALVVICSGMNDPKSCVPKLVATLSKAGSEAKPSLLRILRATGGADALKAVRGAVGDPNNDVHTAAIRVIGEWKTGDAAPVLLELAKNSTTPVDKILSLRGYLGMAARSDVPPPQKLIICRESAAMIQRDDEKLLLLGALANLANVDSLDLAVPYLDDPSVKREAAASVIAIAEKRPANQQPGMTRAALEKVVKVSGENPESLKRAQECLKRMEHEK